MKESNIHDAVFWGQWELNCYNRNNKMACSTAQLAMELKHSNRYGATFVLPANNRKGYELVHQEKKTILLEKDGITIDDLWDCTKEHYGLTAATTFATAVQIPIKKTTLGHQVAPG